MVIANCEIRIVDRVCGQVRIVTRSYREAGARIQSVRLHGIFDREEDAGIGHEKISTGLFEKVRHTVETDIGETYADKFIIKASAEGGKLEIGHLIAYIEFDVSSPVRVDKI